MEAKGLGLLFRCEWKAYCRNVIGIKNKNNDTVEMTYSYVRIRPCIVEPNAVIKD